MVSKNRRYCNREWGHTEEIQWSFINLQRRDIRVLHWITDSTVYCWPGIGMTQSVVFLFHYRWPVSWGDISLNSESNRQLKLGSIGGGGDRVSTVFFSHAFENENPVVLWKKATRFSTFLFFVATGLKIKKGVLYLWEGIIQKYLEFTSWYL